ncbi:terpene synthase family protein [Amycolatopsis sp. GM8]|uniref:terpene synthase family protein n=1 Tax=Amycolatopsis sp. GM8 TaxID=2896530 RepID=UPI001F42D023|nr:terpene synthase family protein [Amycolatopsis sp. GM8]
MTKAAYFALFVDDIRYERAARAGQHEDISRFVMGMAAINDEPTRPPDSDDPALRIWQQLCLELAELDGWETQWRFARCTQVYLHSQMCETPYRQAKTLPDLDTYLTLRPLSCAIHSMFGDVFGIVAGRRVPLRVIADPGIRRLSRLAGQGCGMVNDIMSLHTEPDPAMSFTLPAVIAWNSGCSLREATGEAIRIFYRVLDQIVELQQELGQHEDGDIRFMAMALPQPMQGEITWKINHTHRYDDQSRYR